MDNIFNKFGLLQDICSVIYCRSKNASLFKNNESTLKQQPILGNIDDLMALND